MARTKQTARKSKPTPGMATYQGGTVSSSEEEAESPITETQEEETAPYQGRESSEPAGPSRPSQKRKRRERTASSTLQLAESHRKKRKVAILYSTDETDEDKIPEMTGEGYEFPRKTKQVRLMLPATPSQVTLPRTFVEWFSFYGMRPGLWEALESRQWTEEMINMFISNFREKHGFNRQTAMLPYFDEDNSGDEPIQLEGGRRVVLWEANNLPERILYARGGRRQTRGLSWHLLEAYEGEGDRTNGATGKETKEGKEGQGIEGGPQAKSKEGQGTEGAQAQGSQAEKAKEKEDKEAE